MPSPAPPPEFRQKPPQPHASSVDVLLGEASRNPFLESQQQPPPSPYLHSNSKDRFFSFCPSPDLNPKTTYRHSSSLSEGASAAAFSDHHRRGAPAARNLSLSHLTDVESDRLPEFVGSPGEGVFRPPPRAALHPGRPPSLEVRPHPLRETQAGSFLRTITCTPTQLWAGQESGLRFWDLNDLFSERGRIRVSKGDEESANYRESVHTSPTLCLAVDSAYNFIWSGHRDGKIRSWSMNQSSSDWSSSESASSTSSDYASVLPCFREHFSWLAHRGPVLSMVFTSYGDLWTGSEGGIIKIWPWESLEKSLSVSKNERHVAVLGIERSYVDLRGQVTVSGVCPLPSADVKFLLCDNSGPKVWSGSSMSFAIWNSRTKELLKVFDIDGQVEGRLDILSAHLPSNEDEMKMKFVSTAKKERTQGPMSFFQRSRNVLMGAADAVRRVATKGAFGDDNRRTEAMTISTDGTIWTGCANGALVQWNGNGNRLQGFHYHSSSVQCMCSSGTRVWVGYSSGSVQILDLEGIVLGEWIAHSSPVINMAIGSGYIFTLANHGGIRGWNLASPGRWDEILRSELTKKEHLFTKIENIKVLVGTWNVGQERASYDSLVSWVGSAAARADVIVIGLQEIEMGAGFLAMAAAKETVGLEGSANGQWWLDTIGKTLDEGTAFERIGSRQLAGLLISAWARKKLRRYIGDIDAGAVPCGFGRALGNKGSVGLRMRVYDRVLCFMNCHFAAHLEAVNRRNADFDYVFRSMSFCKPSSGYHSAGASPSPGFQLLPASNFTGPQAVDGKPELSEADMVVFLGDLNYRLDGVTYDEARESISQRSFDWLQEKDQLQAEMRAGRVFQGLREGIIRFPPTYKFERNKVGLSGYDSGEKKRVPAWCDRILYRDTHSISEEECFSDCPAVSNKPCSLECPVISSILEYNACMDVTDSDHKPVRCLFDVDIARADELIRRKEFGNILSSNIEIKSISKQLSDIPEVIVSTNSLILQNQGSSIVRINNCEKVIVTFTITCNGESIRKDNVEAKQCPRAALGFPHWLEVNPVAGIIYPGKIAEVRLHHEDFQTLESWWCEDSRDKEAILAVNVRGSFSTGTKAHLIHVRRCLSPEPQKSTSGIASGKMHSNLLSRADHQNFGRSTDDYLWRFDGP